VTSPHRWIPNPESRLTIIEVNNKSNRNINTTQNRKIASLEAKFAALKKLSSMPKKARKAASKRSRVRKTSHPLSAQVKGLLCPAAALPGTAQHLVDVAPSQKYSLKSRFTQSVAASSSVVGVISPAFIEDNAFPSAIFATGTSTQLNTGTIQNSQVGSSAFPTGVTGSVIKPTRPYLAGTLTWRLVSYQLRVRYAGTALNANGNFKVLNNNHGEIQFANSSGTTTWWNIFEQVDRNVHTSLRTVHDRAVQDYASIGSTKWFDTTEVFCSDLNALEGGIELTGTRIGQASSTIQLGEPGIIFTYTNSSTGSINLECELYENWEVRGPTVAPFMTPSHPDPILHEEVMRTFLSSHVHSSKDSGSSANMVKYIKAANAESKTPLGKAVIAAVLA
jgi:hypothetical protein